MSEIVNYSRRMRNIMRIRQRDMAAIAGVSRQSYCYWETEKKTPSAESQKRLKAAIRILLKMYKAGWHEHPTYRDADPTKRARIVLQQVDRLRSPAKGQS